MPQEDQRTHHEQEQCNQHQGLLKCYAQHMVGLFHNRPQDIILVCDPHLLQLVDQATRHVLEIVPILTAKQAQIQVESEALDEPLAPPTPPVTNLSERDGPEFDDEFGFADFDAFALKACGDAEKSYYWQHAWLWSVATATPDQAEPAIRFLKSLVPKLYRMLIKHFEASVKVLSC